MKIQASPNWHGRIQLPRKDKQRYEDNASCYPGHYTWSWILQKWIWNAI